MCTAIDRDNKNKSSSVRCYFYLFGTFCYCHKIDLMPRIKTGFHSNIWYECCQGVHCFAVHLRRFIEALFYKHTFLYSSIKHDWEKCIYWTFIRHLFIREKSFFHRIAEMRWEKRILTFPPKRATQKISFKKGCVCASVSVCRVPSWLVRVWLALKKSPFLATRLAWLKWRRERRRKKTRISIKIQARAPISLGQPSVCLPFKEWHSQPIDKQSFRQKRKTFLGGLS